MNVIPEHQAALPQTPTHRSKRASAQLSSSLSCDQSCDQADVGRRGVVGSLAAAAALLALVACAAPAVAEEPYRLPSEDLVQIVDAPGLPATRLSPDQKWLLLLYSPSLPSIAELAEEELRLAGARLRPRVFAPSRTRPYDRLSLIQLAGGEQAEVGGLPQGALIESVSWSPNSRHLVLSVLDSEAVRPWLVDVSLDSPSARQLISTRLHMVARNSPTWLPDSSGILAATVPAGARARPERNRVPRGPVIQESEGSKAPARTYQDLLTNNHDEELFEHYFTSQLAVVDLEGNLKNLGSPGLVVRYSPAPDGRHVLVEQLQRPFSYRVPYYRFPKQSHVWDLGGKSIATVADVPLQDAVPMAFGSVPTGPRSLQWRADSPATLLWAEALDGGDAGRSADLRDRLLLQSAPFDEPPRELAQLETRFSGILWGSGDLALLNERWWKDRSTKTWRVRPDSRSQDNSPALLFDRSYEDRYSDPGRPLTRRNAQGRVVVATSRDGQRIWLRGGGASPQGDRPFLDELNLATGETKRLFESAAPHFERPIDVVEDSAGTMRLLLSRESADEPPNLFLENLDRSRSFQITKFTHPTPSLRGLSKEVIKYTRSDGVALTGTLYLPPGYTPDQGPLPMLMWAYPREFKSAAAAGQVRGSDYFFDRINHWSSLIWLSRGYAVLDNPTMPIVGEGTAEPNDTYVEQLVASAQAAVDEVVRRGVTSSDQIAIGGHSYGAFMTANLLAHSDLFAAGIARSGAYNRTLTPFGFQSEERSYWEAPDVYFSMSPFMHAEKVDEPILLIHGALDNNSGTFPIQSERYFAALQGHGATARLVMLPLESHGYRSRESLLHMLWEQEEWLERYVRPQTSDTSSSGDGAE